MSHSVFAQLGGALIGGAAGGGIVGGLTNFVTKKIQDKRQDTMEERIGCYEPKTGQKIAKIEEVISLPQLDLERARKEYYATKHGTGLIP